MASGRGFLETTTRERKRKREREREKEREREARRGGCSSRDGRW